MKNSKQIKTAYAYIRASKGDGDISVSVLDQEHEIEQYCSSHNICIIKKFVDYQPTDNDLDRSELIALMGKCALDKAVCVVVTNYDRLSRNVYDFIVIKHALKQLGVELISTTKSVLTDEPIEQTMNELIAVINSLHPRLSISK